MRRVMWLLVCGVVCFAGCSSLDRAPTAILEASTWLGLAPLEVTFSAIKSMDDHAVVQVEWDFGDGEIIASEKLTMTHVYASPGTYPVRIVVIDSQGATDEATGILVISNREPVANFRTTNDAPVVGETVRFDASASHDPDGDPLTYSWGIGGRTIAGEEVSYQFAHVGLTLVTLTVEDGHGGSDTASHELNVLDPSSVVWGGCGR